MPDDYHRLLPDIGHRYSFKLPVIRNRIVGSHVSVIFPYLHINLERGFSFKNRVSHDLLNDLYSLMNIPPMNTIHDAVVYRQKNATPPALGQFLVQADD